nr:MULTISPECIES: heparan-alpha-glucosaminide N-acetyltransferase domain-containing protein [unclassified Lysobacter]
MPAIDILRGVVMLLMLLDHVRETFFFHHQVSDPMDVGSVEPALFVTRMLAHLCAPAFVFLTGMSAFLYGRKQPAPRRAASEFLLQRGALLIVLELSVVNFAWTAEFPPSVVYLQVIWAIGISMVALAALLWLPRPWLLAIGAALVAGHNLLDGYQGGAPGPAHTLWLILHERGWFEIAGVRLRTSYPVLPWIGVIALGYVAGAWYASAGDAARRRGLAMAGLLLLAGFFAVRGVNAYGDAPWRWGDSLAATAMSFFNVTKYPPSLQFVLLTLGVGACLLCLFERPRIARALLPLATFGAAPMFFYLVHLYLLKALYLVSLWSWGPSQGAVFGVGTVTAVWGITAVVALALWLPTQAFARLKARRRDWAWLRYL